MTAQIPERLMIEGRMQAMCTNPLWPYLCAMTNPPEFEAPSSALWRGYIGSWEIDGDRLFLLSIEGQLKDGSHASVGSVFPGARGRVFAEWFSGEIRIPLGRLLHYEHAGYASQYERDRLLQVEGGVIRSDEVRQNGLSDEADREDGYQISAMTVFPHKKIN